MPDPHLRAADVDRQAVAARLGQHLSEGRLTVEEYDERVAAAYAARTYADLDTLFADLPGPVPAAPARRIPGSTSTGSMLVPRHRHVTGDWARWASVAVIVTAIWLFTGIAGGFHHFWPVWVIGPWGAVLLARTVSGGQPPAQGRRRC